MATLIKTDGTTTEVAIDETRRLEWMQEQVGGYIEMIPMKDGRTIVVDEEGILKQKPPSTEGTKLLWLNSPAHMAAKTVVCGDVLILTPEEMNVERKNDVPAVGDWFEYDKYKMQIQHVAGDIIFDFDWNGTIVVNSIVVRAAEDDNPGLTINAVAMGFDIIEVVMKLVRSGDWKKHIGDTD